jgi:hypothetical protein
LETLGYNNVWVRTANGTLGWPDEAPFERILVAAGGPGVPPPLFDQLVEGGRMVMPVGDATRQVLKLVEKVNGEMRQQADLSEMIWNVPDTIAYLSEYYLLKPGDLIYTGTPAGVGAVKKGDQMVGSVDGLGELAVSVA